MSLTAGSRLGAYEVASLIGVGGMGEVYRARDLKLGRDVALKVLPQLFALDVDRLARFKREAQVLASLNHPNIAAIYGFEDSDGAHALVLELVEGPTLADRIAQGAIALDDALPIAKQISDALETAHEQGIVHRDLKPANIKLRPDGTVKVLDFGLAKLTESSSASGTTRALLSESPTITTPAMTMAGMILGTAAYMSPEQARGKVADRRADIWAFGCVLFEMLTGKQAFEARGETVSDAIAVILLRDPDWTALPPDTPAHIHTLLRRCLQKDPQRRLPHIGVVRLEIDEGLSPSPAAAPAVGRQSATRLASSRHGVPALAWSAAGLIGGMAIAGALAWVLFRPVPTRTQPVRFAIAPQANFPLRPGGGDVNVAVSEDGSQIVYVSGPAGAEGPLMLRGVDQLEPVPLRGVTGRYPFFSPDGKWIGFFSGGDIKKVATTGGPAIPLCRPNGGPRGAAWGGDNTIVFATSDLTTGLWRVSSNGGEPTLLTKPDLSRSEGDHVDPVFLPGRTAVLFMINNAGAGGVGDGQIAVFDLPKGTQKMLVRGGGNAGYVDHPTESNGPGYLVYAALGTLRAVRFDPARMEIVGDAVPVADQVMPAGGGAAEFAVSRNGTLVYAPDNSPGAAGAVRSLVWVDRHGRQQPIDAPRRGYVSPRLSPDGTRLALQIQDQQNTDIWIWDISRKTLTPLTSNPAADINPVWTGDGRNILFASTRSGPANSFWRAADGTGKDERLTTSANPQIPTSISSDGQHLIVMENVPGTGPDIRSLKLDSTAAALAKRSADLSKDSLKSEPLIQTTFTEYAGELSPDGRFLAYYSNEGGQNQVIVRPFPKVDEGRWQISPGGGSRPVWSRTGRELFYLDPAGAMMAVPIQTTPTFVAGNPTKLFEGRWFAGQNGRIYDVSADGQRFLMITATGTGEQPSTVATLNVVVNWSEELKQRVPTK